jgi:predicted transcriptional regulator
MSKQKEADRHTEPKMVVYPMRVRVDHLAIVRTIAKKRDRTRQAIFREALAQWIERNWK